MNRAGICWTLFLMASALAGVRPTAAQEIVIDPPASSVALDGIYRLKAVSDADPATVTLQVTLPAVKEDYAFKRATISGVNANIKVVELQRNSEKQPASVEFKNELFNKNITLEVTAVYAKDGMNPVPYSVSSRITLHLDSLPPRPINVVAQRYPGGSGTLTIEFEDFDLDEGTVAVADFYLYEEFVRDDGQSVFNKMLVQDPKVSSDKHTVELTVPNLHPGNYWIIYQGLSDVVGNSIPTVGDADILSANNLPKLSFVVSGSRERGEQIEFPRFLRPGNEKSEFDPGDLVDTRVVQLYYFRDARRVAELINRNVRNLNQVGYDEAQRFAAEARRRADEAVDHRRFHEVLAVEAARKTRETEQLLEETRQALESALQQQDVAIARQNQLANALDAVRPSGQNGASVQAMIDATNARLDEIDEALNAMPPPSGQPRQDLEEERKNLELRRTTLRSIETQQAINERERTRLTEEITQLNARLQTLPSQLTQDQQAEIIARNSVVTAEATELRAAEEQFRREVAAGLADPDTYAAAKLESYDPVTQVSISVVGTSRLQLRGPIKGINKIRRMIHQIDSPVGQVKIGIHTVQVNGEHGDRMDFVYERINREVAHSRFLVNTSGRLFRRAVQQVATEVAMAVDQGYIPVDCPPEFGGGTPDSGFATLGGGIQTSQTLRDWRYVYSFFGADFIDELRRMDSELLNTDNKMLSLHSMDTISLAGALTVTALADYPVRHRILEVFQELVATELPAREVEYVRALTHVTEHGKSLQNRFLRTLRIDEQDAEEIYFNASRTYTFPNTLTFFNERIPGQGTLNPVQYATIKMAQTLKAQLVAEMEYKNLVLERSLLETRESKTEADYRAAVQAAEMGLQEVSRKQQLEEDRLFDLIDLLSQLIRTLPDYLMWGVPTSSDQQSALPPPNPNGATTGTVPPAPLTDGTAPSSSAPAPMLLNKKNAELATVVYEEALKEAAQNPEFARSVLTAALEFRYADEIEFGRGVVRAIISIPPLNRLDNPDIIRRLNSVLADVFAGKKDELVAIAKRWEETEVERIKAEEVYANARAALAEAQEKLFAKRLLEQFMDEQEEKSVALMEALREYSSNVDNYLKRLAIALEDDVAAQFYEPAFQRIRRVSRTWDVTLGQIETTTVLTNNRTLAKVDPTATFEFDLPKRDILITEAMAASKALALEYGNLLQDGTFLAGSALLAGQPPAGIIGDNAPIQGIPGVPSTPPFGSELQKLIPEPEIYKFETGTGFEIRPVIQPDGQSIVYTFDYMYTTNVREPVRADEKHLGRVKRHFVHTDVQTSSYELREVSRYTVALKAARTDRGVPLLEDVPGVGALFRPLPSAESSLQTNIILASSTIYPTMFDLMGLRWSPYVDDLQSTTLADEKQQQIDRRTELRTHLLETTRRRVNDRIGIPNPQLPRIDDIPAGFPAR